MFKKQEKYCPRCDQLFECQAGNITECRCFDIDLSEEDKKVIGKQFSDCLCGSCLLELKNEFALRRKQLPLQKNSSNG